MSTWALKESPHFFKKTPKVQHLNAVSFLYREFFHKWLQMDISSLCDSKLGKITYHYCNYESFISFLSADKCYYKINRSFSGDVFQIDLYLILLMHHKNIVRLNQYEFFTELLTVLWHRRSTYLNKKIQKNFQLETQTNNCYS